MLTQDEVETRRALEHLILMLKRQGKGRIRVYPTGKCFYNGEWLSLDETVKELNS